MHGANQIRRIQPRWSKQYQIMEGKVLTIKADQLQRTYRIKREEEEEECKK